MNSEYKLSVFNTITRRYEEIEVTKEIYREYKRTEWAIENDDRSFREHQIVFSCLKGGENNNYELFDEFVRASIEAEEENVCDVNDHEEFIRKAVDSLKPKQREVIEELFFKGKTQVKYSEESGISQRTISNRKKAALKKLKEIFEKSG